MPATPHLRTARGRPPKGLIGPLTVALVAGVLAAPASAEVDDEDLLPGHVYDVDAAPDGSLLYTQDREIKELRRGQVSTLAELPTVRGEGPIGEPGIAPVNGIEVLGRGNLFATTGALDQGEGAALWRVSRGNARLVADLGAFERAVDPDATEGFAWKDHACEGADGYTPGPQSNPYHLAARSGSEVVIADAAGNSVLTARTDGQVDWLAVLPPAYVDGDPDEWLVQRELDDGTPCYVQPVPTAVDIGPDGATYVGELSGTPTDPADLVGLARVWRIAPGATNVVCPSEDCEVVADELTSIIDLEFGPDGRLHVLEFDVNGWLATFAPDLAGGGQIQVCDVDARTCEPHGTDLELFAPGALTFDEAGRLWVVDDMYGVTADGPAIVDVGRG